MVRASAKNRISSGKIAASWGTVRITISTLMETYPYGRERVSSLRSSSFLSLALSLRRFSLSPSFISSSFVSETPRLICGRPSLGLDRPVERRGLRAQLRS